MLDFKIKNYEALPCSLKIFTINGQEAYEHDFGHSFIDDSYEPIEYGCSYRGWERTDDEDHINETMKKYNITRKEFNEICDKLEYILTIGPCGWCV